MAIRQNQGWKRVFHKIQKRVKKMKYVGCKNEKGQVLLMVIITSTIALLIVTGVFMRVLRLTRQRVEMESHEIAFSSAEKYARMILDQLEMGIIPDVSGWVGQEGYEDLVAARRVPVDNIEGFNLDDGSSFEISDGNSGTFTDFSINSDWNGGIILFTTVYYSDSNGDGKEDYSVLKRIFESCTSSDGDLSSSVVGCTRTFETDTFKYYHQANEVAVRVKVIGADISLDIDSGMDLFNEFYLTTKEENTLSEAVLKVPANKSMPSLFDHVLYNGTGEIVK